MSLPNLAAEQGQIWGMGVRHALFPALTLGASPQRCCQLPDAILHGKRSLFGLVAGPSSTRFAGH